MKSIKEILEELRNKPLSKVEKEFYEMAPVYVPGDWEDGKNPKIFDYDTRLSWELENGYIFKSIFIKKIEKEIIYIFNKKIDRINIGYIYKDKDDIERFRTIGYVELIRVKSVEQLKKDYKPLYQISKIFIDKNYRKKGLGQLTYLSMLEDLKINIMSDRIQFDAPKYIYSKFSNFKTIHCDIILKTIKNFNKNLKGNK